MIEHSVDKNTIFLCGKIASWNQNTWMREHGYVLGVQGGFEPEMQTVSLFVEPTSLVENLDLLKAFSFGNISLAVNETPISLSSLDNLHMRRK